MTALCKLSFPITHPLLLTQRRQGTVGGHFGQKREAPGGEPFAEHSSASRASARLHVRLPQPLFSLCFRTGPLCRNVCPPTAEQSRFFVPMLEPFVLPPCILLHFDYVFFRKGATPCIRCAFFYCKKRVSEKLSQPLTVEIQYLRVTPAPS